jgi:hypothetical protein
MNSPSDINKAESLPIGDTITMTKETARGLINIDNRFQVDSQGAFFADRWTVGFFNLRSNPSDGDGQAEKAFKELPHPHPAPTANENHFTLRIETKSGFIDRGGRFNVSGDGGNTGDRFVSEWFNLRLASEKVTGA